ncbi:MAG: ABC transporter ATP-binding protein [Sellimonas sp.]|nr:ABC transporter ATP-binding protein [Sellimonas sp.]
MEEIKVKNLIKNYLIDGNKKNTIRVLRGLDITVEQGEFIAVMGKSGCGKTTLLKILGLIDQPTAGEILFMGKNTKELYPDELADIRRNRIGFVFQDFYLMDSISVEENIMLPMILGKKKSDEMKKVVRQYAERFEISHLLEKNPYELSGGEKQRTAICRALVNSPDIILADEPTGNLDSKSGQIVVEALKSINQDLKKTIVMVTHDPQMASVTQRVIYMKDGIIMRELNGKKIDLSSIMALA